MAAKRVLIISLDYYPGEVGGAEVAIKSITDRIDAKEIEFHLVTLHYDKSMAKVEQIDNVLVHRIGFGWKNPTISDRKKFPLHYNKHLFQFTAACKAARLHMKYRYDGVWAMMAHSCGVPAALFTLFFRNVRFILTLQEGDPPEEIEHKARFAWPLFKCAFVRADVIQVISTFLGRWATRMGHTKEPIVVPNAVNYAHFHKKHDTAVLDDVRTQIGKKPGDIFLITTSRMVHKNGVDTVIRALPLLPAHIHFVIYGGGPDKETLEALATELGVHDRVLFGGLLDQMDIPKYLQACDIFIRPSRSEGMGNSFVEAMAAGLPVIATQEGGIADFLFDAKRNPEKGTTGWAVDADNPEQIADAVLDIIDHPEVVREVVARSQVMVQSSYDWDVVAKRMREEVFSILFK